MGEQFGRLPRQLKQLYQAVMADDCLLLAAEMAFNLLFAIVPTVIFMVSVLALIGYQLDWQRFLGDTLYSFAPHDTIQTIQTLGLQASKFFHIQDS